MGESLVILIIAVISKYYAINNGKPATANAIYHTVQTQAILTSLQEQGIEDVHIEILKDIHLYTDSSVTVHMHEESEKIRIKRGVRQGETISPNHRGPSSSKFTRVNIHCHRFQRVELNIMTTSVI